jgi:catechol 2,3-dioxygenase-like lactoylglutathione lyase family enzyme
MAKVLGIGGVFFKAEDPAGLRDWYRRVLGLTVESWGGVMFEPSTLDTMINFVVDDLDGVLAQAAAEGAAPIGREDQDGQGRFAWLLDPAGRKIELWEPAPED